VSANPMKISLITTLSVRADRQLRRYRWFYMKELDALRSLWLQRVYSRQNVDSRAAYEECRITGLISSLL
jgi:hypothetical protein